MEYCLCIPHSDEIHVQNPRITNGKSGWEADAHTSSCSPLDGV